MYFYTSGSADAPKINNNFGDMNAIFNYIIDGGSQYDVTRIEPLADNRFKVYYTNTNAFTLYQTVKISGSAIAEYNSNTWFIEEVNTESKYYVCYNKNAKIESGIADTVGMKVGIRHSGIQRKFGGVDDFRTVMKFSEGIEVRIDDRDWRKQTNPIVADNATTNNYFKIARLSMSSNYSSLDSNTAPVFPYNSQFPELTYKPVDKKIGTASFIQYTRIEEIYYPIQTTSEPAPVAWSIFATDKSMILILQNTSSVGWKYLYHFGGFDRENTNIANGYLFSHCDSSGNGTINWDTSSFPSHYAYGAGRNLLNSSLRSELENRSSVCSVVYDNGQGVSIGANRFAEFGMAPTNSGYSDGRSLKNTNGPNGGTYFCDALIVGSESAGTYTYYGKIYDVKWVCTNMRGFTSEGKIFVIDGEYYYSYIHNMVAATGSETVNLIKLDR